MVGILCFAFLVILTTISPIFSPAFDLPLKAFKFTAFDGDPPTVFTTYPFYRQGVSAPSGEPQDEISVLIGTAFERKLDFLRKYFQNRGGQSKKIILWEIVCGKVSGKTFFVFFPGHQKIEREIPGRVSAHSR